MSETALHETGPVAEESLQWVTFRLGGETCGISVLKVHEVLKSTEITPVPGSPPYVLGIINLRGYVVTVIDTRARMNMPPREADEETRIIFVEVHGQLIGMLVDCVSEVVSLRRSQINSPPSVNNEDQENSRHIEGIYSDGNQILILMDVDQLFESEDLSEAAGF